MTKEEDYEKDVAAYKIIRQHIGYAMMGGAIPVPLLDLTAVTAVQLDMLRQLAQLYEADFQVSRTKAFVASLSTALGGSMGGRAAASMVKLVPGVGWLVGGLTQVIVTGASTYATGRVFQKIFREHRSVEDVDWQEVKEAAQEHYEEGKKVAAEIRDEARKKGPSR